VSFNGTTRKLTFNPVRMQLPEAGQEKTEKGVADSSDAAVKYRTAMKQARALPGPTLEAYSKYERDNDHED
jgi:hypothetical protein